MQLPESIPQGLERGRVRDLLHLGPEDMQIMDIASRLAKINRYCGATKWPFSVATHSVLVSRLCSYETARAGLLHDITETFGIGDVISPIKRVILGAKEIEEAVRLQLVRVFPELEDHAHADVRWADERAYQLECWYLRGAWPRPEHTSFPCEPLGPYEHRDLFERELSWQQSRDLFLTRYTELFT